MNSTHHDAESNAEEDQELLSIFNQQDADFLPQIVTQNEEDSTSGHGIQRKDFDRSADTMVAIVKYQEQTSDSHQRDATEKQVVEEKVAGTPVFTSRKRKTLDLPNAPAQIIRPVAKRPKLDVYGRCITAPASLMGNVSLDRTRDCFFHHIEETACHVENEADNTNGPFRSASVNIPENFQPIIWPGDIAVLRKHEKDGHHSCSFSSSSSKSFASGFELVCRRGLDVSSPLRVSFNDLALHPSAGSYTGS